MLLLAISLSSFRPIFLPGQDNAQYGKDDFMCIQAIHIYVLQKSDSITATRVTLLILPFIAIAPLRTFMYMTADMN